MILKFLRNGDRATVLLWETTLDKVTTIMVLELTILYG